jgi:hypothetical protein
MDLQRQPRRRNRNYAQGRDNDLHTRCPWQRRSGRTPRTGGNDPGSELQIRRKRRPGISNRPARPGNQIRIRLLRQRQSRNQSRRRQDDLDLRQKRPCDHSGQPAGERRRRQSLRIRNENGTRRPGPADQGHRPARPRNQIRLRQKRQPRIDDRRPRPHDQIHL